MPTLDSEMVMSIPGQHTGDLGVEKGKQRSTKCMFEL